MRRKVSTLIEESLFRRVKLEAARSGRQINEIVGEALEGYLLRGVGEGAGGSVVADSWGALALDRHQVKRLLEEDGLFDA